MTSEIVSSDSAPALEYVGFGRRLAARLIDTAIHFAVAFVAGFVIALLAVFMQGVTGHSADAVMNRLQHGGAFGLLVGLMGSFVYELVMEAFHGSTCGKHLVGITVLDESGRPCRLIGAAKRSLLYFWDSLFFGLVAESSMKQTEKRQRYGDRWGHTVVVFRRSAPSTSLRSFLRFALVFILACAADGAILVWDAWIPLLT